MRVTPSFPSSAGSQWLQKPRAGWMNEHLSCALSPSRTKFAVWQHAAPHDQPEVTRCPTYYSCALRGLKVMICAMRNNA